MTKFRHPHVTRGIVHTSRGAFTVRRGVIDAPDAIGEAFGWCRVEDNPLATSQNAEPTEYMARADDDGHADRWRLGRLTRAARS
jgi:hypothetical protein